MSETSELESEQEPVEDEARDLTEAAEVRELKPGMKACPICEGAGTIRDGSTECPDCEGTGEVGEQQNSADVELEQRKRVREIIEGTVERRDFKADVEIRETSDGGLRFSGYASTTETPYPVGGFTETFARGAFKRCLGEQPDVVLLINHEGLPLARTRSGTMTLSEDTRGLKVDADLDPSDPDVQALVPKMKRGDLTEMSFAFKATDDEWSERDTKRVVRAATIHKGDVSMVTHGANTDTSGTITMRSDAGSFELRIDEERIGKALSNAKKAKLEAIKGEIDEILGTPDEPEPVAPVADPFAVIIPSGIEAARAAKARAERRAA
jgi:HK97 family phage prohead protease